MCGDGNYCCDNDPTCCSEGRGIVLNNDGHVISTKSGTSTAASSRSSSTADSSTTNSSLSSSVSAAPSLVSIVIVTPTPGANESNAAAAAETLDHGHSSSMSTGAKIGIATGATAGVLVVGISSFLLFRYRKPQPRGNPARPVIRLLGSQDMSTPYEDYQPRKEESINDQSSPMELDDHPSSEASELASDESRRSRSIHEML